MWPLCVAYLVSRVKGSRLDVGKHACWGLGIAFMFFAIGHAIMTEGMVEMLPSWVPFRVELIYITGVLELAIAVSLLIPRFQIMAAKVAILVLVLFFPANVYSALNSVGLGGHQWGPVYLLIRFPLQLILIAWAYFLCIKRNSRYSQLG